MLERNNRDQQRPHESATFGRIGRFAILLEATDHGGLNAA